MASSIKMLISMGVDPDDKDIVVMDDAVVSAGDIETTLWCVMNMDLVRFRGG